MLTLALAPQPRPLPLPPPATRGEEGRAPGPGAPPTAPLLPVAAAAPPELLRAASSGEEGRATSVPELPRAAGELCIRFEGLPTSVGLLLLVAPKLLFVLPVQVWKCRVKELRVVRADGGASYAHVYVPVCATCVCVCVCPCVCVCTTCVCV